MSEPAIDPSTLSSGETTALQFETLAATMHKYGAGVESWDKEARPQLPPGKYAADCDPTVRRDHAGNPVLEPQPTHLYGYDPAIASSPDEAIARLDELANRPETTGDIDAMMREVPGGRHGHGGSSGRGQRIEPYKPKPSERLEARIRQLMEDGFDEPRTELVAGRVSKRTHAYMTGNQHCSVGELVELVATGMSESGMDLPDALLLVRAFVRELGEIGKNAAYSLAPGVI